MTEEIGDRLRALRKARTSKIDPAKTVSLREMSEDIGVSHNAINRWEKGRSTPSKEHLIALSEYFNVSIARLAFGKLGTKSKDEQTESDELVDKMSLLSSDAREVIEALADILIQNERKDNGGHGAQEK